MARSFTEPTGCKRLGSAITALLSCVILLVMLLTARSRSMRSMPQNLGRLQTPKYLAFVDCGSTGSRLHAFEVQVLDQSPKSFTVVPLGNPTKVDTPLASLHHQNLEGTRQVITPLLGAAKRLVPSKYHRSTPLFVWATAGMRTLNQASQHQIYDRVFESVSLNPTFYVQRSHFTTLSGEDEGFYGWLAVNYVNGANIPAVLHDQSMTDTTGALDVGGGSVQAVFLSSKPDRMEGVAALRSAMFIRSWMGYGAKYMETQIKKVLVAELTDTYEPVENPCAFPGTEEEIGGRRVVGVGVFAGCLRLIQNQLQLKAKHAEGLRLPEAAMRQQFWGMSLLYHVTHFLWLVVPTMPFPRPAINDITAAGTVLCSKNFAALVQDYEGKDPNTPRRRMPGRCFDAALTVALLGRPWGWGFAANARQVTMVHNVSGVEVEWTIGAAVAKASEFAEASAAEAAALHVAWTSDVFLLLPCVVLLPAALYLAYSYRRLGLQCPSSPRIERMSPP